MNNEWIKLHSKQEFSILQNKPPIRYLALFREEYFIEEFIP
jgi:hypothetical protein